MTKIYGLIEKAGIGEFVIAEKHPELEEILKNTKNSKVGIELCDATLFGDKELAPGVSIEFPEIYVNLYNRLKEGNAICFLDEDLLTPLVAGFAKKRAQGNITRLDKYKFSIKQDYVAGVMRSEAMLERIKKDNPDIALIGAAHAYDLYKWGFDGEILIECPINCDELTEKLNQAYEHNPNMKGIEKMIESFEMVYKMVPVASMSEEQKSDYGLVEKSNKGLRKQYNFIEKGELLTQGKKPDFVGSWRLDMPLYGYFEMCITKRDGDEVEGTISDFIGDAKFGGRLNENNFVFIKEYTKTFSEGALGGLIPYELEFTTLRGKDKVFIGTYGAGFMKDDVLLIAYSPELEKHFLNADNSRELMQSVLMPQ